MMRAGKVFPMNCNASASYPTSAAYPTTVAAMANAKAFAGVDLICAMTVAGSTECMRWLSA